MISEYGELDNGYSTVNGLQFKIMEKEHQLKTLLGFDSQGGMGIFTKDQAEKLELEITELKLEALGFDDEEI